MAVALLDSHTADLESTNPSNFSVSAGSNRILLVGYTQEPFDTATLTSLDYGGNTLTKVADALSNPSSGTRVSATWFYLDEADIASAGDTVFDSLVFSGTGPVDIRRGWVVASYEGVDQTTPIFHNNENGDDSGAIDPITVDLNNKTDAIAIALAVEGAAARSFDWSGGDAFTEQSDNSGGTQTFSYSTAHYAMSTGAGTSTASADQFSGPTSEMAIAGIVLNPASGGGGGGDVPTFIYQYLINSE